MSAISGAQPAAVIKAKHTKLRLTLGSILRPLWVSSMAESSAWARIVANSSVILECSESGSTAELRDDSADSAHARRMSACRVLRLSAATRKATRMLAHMLRCAAPPTRRMCRSR